MSDNPAPRRISRRLLRLVRVAAEHAGDRVRARGALLGGHDGSRARLELRHRQAAARMTDSLGALRGGPAKLGQLLSFFEPTFVPGPYRELYKRELARLRDAAPPMSWQRAEGVLTEAWGTPLSALFDEFEPRPAAAASIGQVHRARLLDGREVAVKVQYPEIAEALRSDARIAAIVIRTLARSAPGLDTSEAGQAIAAGLIRELDYAYEAEHQQAFADAYRGHPFITVPGTVSELTRPTVLVSDWIEGERFEHVRASPQADRDRFAEILLRFYLASFDVLGRFNPDPHPGNYLLCADGRVAFLDFGAAQRDTGARRAGQIAITRAYLAGDTNGLLRAMAQAGYIGDAARADARQLMRSLALNDGWLLEDRSLRLDANFMTHHLEQMADLNSDVQHFMRYQRLPVEELANRRLQLSLLAVLAQLEATANWSRIMREWWLGDPPATELGASERRFFATRNLWRDPTV